MTEKLFGLGSYRDDIEDTQMQLLQTIKVPKNLLYLTDRLPKPHYEVEKAQQKKSKKSKIRHSSADADEVPPFVNRKNNQHYQSVQAQETEMHSRGTADSQPGPQKPVKERSQKKRQGPLS